MGLTSCVGLRKEERLARRGRAPDRYHPGCHVAVARAAADDTLVCDEPVWAGWMRARVVDRSTTGLTSSGFNGNCVGRTPGAE